MNLTNLTYFIIAAEELNFSRAARRLYISQQALSSNIAKLEDFYQVQLFDRGRPMTLTDAGKVLYQAALDVTDIMDECTRRVQDIKEFTRGNLSVAIPVTRGTVMLPRLFRTFHQLYPNVTFTVFEAQTTPDVEEVLSTGKVDLAIGYIPQDPTNIISVPLYEETYVLVAPYNLLRSSFSPQELDQMQHHPVSMSLFANLPFIAQDEETKGGKIFKKLCKEAGFSPKVILTSVNILTQLNLCSAGLGLCTIPSTFVTQMNILPGFPREVLINFDVVPDFVVFELESAIGTAPLAVSRLRTKLLTQAGSEFIRIAQELYQE